MEDNESKRVLDSAANSYTDHLRNPNISDDGSIISFTSYAGEITGDSQGSETYLAQNPFLIHQPNTSDLSTKSFSEQALFTFTPDNDFNGQVTLNYVVADSNGGRTLASTSFSIASINDAPELAQGLSSINLANIQEDSELVFTEAQLLNGFSDRDGDTLS